MYQTECKCVKPTNSLRLEADFSADPIWCDICNWNLDLIALPLSIELEEEMRQWTLEWGKWINWNTDQLVTNAVLLEKAHNEWGLKLFHKIKSELGNMFYLKFSPSNSVEAYLQRDQYETDRSIDRSKRRNP